MESQDVPQLTEESQTKVKEIAEKSPQKAKQVIYASLDLGGLDEAEEVLRNTLPTTEGRGRHSMDYCLDCNPYWNGSYGEEGTEAIARFYVEDEPDLNQWLTGWMGLCEIHAEAYSQRDNHIEPLEGHEDNALFKDGEIDTGDCAEHDWQKHSMVTESGGFDWMKCEECGVWGKRYNPQTVEVVGYER